MNITDITGKPISPDTNNTTSVGHSILGEANPHTTNGSTSPEVASPVTPYLAFRNQVQKETAALRKSTWTDQMTDRLMSRLDQVEDYFSDNEKFKQKLEKASLAQLALYEGLMIDKIHTLTGKASQIVSVQHQAKIDELLPAMMDALKQRGLTVTATERKVEMVTK